MDQRKPDWLSIGQVALSILTVFIAGSLLVGLLFWGFSLILSSGIEHSDPTPAFWMGAISMGIGILTLPSGYYGVMRILGRPGVDSRKFIRKLKPQYWILALPVVILLGALVSQSKAGTWLLLPFLHLFAVGIPIVWILYLSIHGLPTGSSQRLWGVFNMGMTLTPIIIMLGELLTGFGFLLVFVLCLAGQPKLLNQIADLARQFQLVESQEAMIELIAPYLGEPLIVGLVLVFVALVVPMIEEMLKPIGVWLLIGRRLTPAAGFAAGALSGAGYGFIESLLLSSNAQEWFFLVLARIGTASVHILTAGLMGWALVQIRLRRRFARLGMAYLSAVLLHGLWNGLTISYSLRALALLSSVEIIPPILNAIGVIAPFGLIFFSIGSFLLLLWFNRLLQA